MKFKLIIASAILIFLVGFLSGWYLKSCPEIKENNLRETVSVETKNESFDIQIKPETKAERKIKKVDIKPMDTTIALTKKFWSDKLPEALENYDYKAIGDTTIDVYDSTGNLQAVLYLLSEYRSAMPLHPDGEFRFKGDVKTFSYNKEKVYSETIIVEKLPKWLLSAGVRMFYSNSKILKTPFIGLKYQMKLAFLYLGIEGKGNAILEGDSPRRIKMEPEICATVSFIINN